MRSPAERRRRRSTATLIIISALALAAAGTAALRPARAADAGRSSDAPSSAVLALRPTAVTSSAPRPRPAEVTVVVGRNPGVELDRLAEGEARLGAGLAGARFRVIDATSARGRTRLARLGVSSTPAVILMQAGLPPLRLEGFGDRDVIAEAARVARWR